MNTQTIFAVLATVLSISCFLPYLRDIFRRKTTPHSHSWLIWTLLQATGVLAMVHSGAGGGVASLIVGAVLCAFIFLLSLRYGTKNITVFDTVCLFGALIAIAVWLFLHNALLSIIAVSLIDLLAFLPTFRKSYVEPHSETISTYILSAGADGCAILALSTLSVTTSLYLITLLITNSICAGIIWFRRAHIRNIASTEHVN